MRACWGRSRRCGGTRPPARCGTATRAAARSTGGRTRPRRGGRLARAARSTACPSQRPRRWRAARARPAWWRRCGAAAAAHPSCV
eukprot:3475783-Prymnesium_polylepis.1